MENLQLDNDKLNKSINPAVNLPRLSDGSLNLEAIAIGKNEKNNYIVPDEVMTNYYRELPSGTVNQSGTFTAYNGGLLKALDNETRKKGGEALQAQIKQRRKIAETIDIFLRKKASQADIEAYGLEAGATKQDALVAAMMERAIEQKDVNAFNSLRDTAGEKPTDKIDAEVTQITPEVEELIKRVASRNEIID